MSTEPRRLGKYELRERLARGGQGEVWKAFDPQLRRYVAIKQLHANLQSDPDFVLRFEREARFIAALRHPNIVQIHDFQIVQTPGSDTTTAYMVMDYIEGPTLAEYIRNTSRKGLFPNADDVVYIFTGVSLALDYAHEKGMIHRDIKPANIMLDQRSQSGRSIGEPILTDFGIAKLQGVSSDTTKVLGTPRYVSPEQAQGLPGDKRSDLYSLGIILYEVTTGITPFRSDSVVAILMQHMQELATPPALINPNIPPALSEVILKSIAKDPDSRFQSACALTVALAQALNVLVPTELRRNMFPPNIIGNANFHNPAGVTPSPSTPAPVQLSPLPGVSPPSVFTPPVNGRYAPSPTRGVAEGGPYSQPGIYTPTSGMPQMVQAPSPPVPPPHLPGRRQKNLYVALVVLLVAVVIGAGLLYAFLRPQGTTPQPVAGESVGQVLFLSSPNAPPGSLDEVQLTLQGIANAPAGKHYYAWLQNNNDSAALVHWSFPVQNGHVSFSYSDAQHRNLLTNELPNAPYLFLITLESQDVGVPFPDSRYRLYYARIPQTKSSADNYSVVDHLNHLLTSDPNLKKLGLDGGLNYWLLRDTQALSEQAIGARDAWQNKDSATLRQHLVNILYYLDGGSCAPADLGRVPAGTSTMPTTTVAHDANASLLECKQNSVISSIPVHIQTHMLGVIHAPGATRNQIALTRQIQAKLAQIQSLYEQIHQNVLQLVQLPDTQLLQPAQQALIGTIVMQTTAAYSGTSSLSGVQQISVDVQHLAMFDVFPCPHEGTTNVCMS